MRQRECGACRGERGCKGCVRAETRTVFSSAADFFPPEKAAAQARGDASVKAGEEEDVVWAVDIGTTTLAFSCAQKTTGRVFASFCVENPQRSFGADVISRLSAAEAGHAKELQKQIKEALLKGFLFLREAGGNVTGIAAAGNTAMLHLLLGYPTRGLARAPFTPYSLAAEEYPFYRLFAEEKEAAGGRLENMPPVCLFAGLSAFVGADAFAGAYALFAPFQEAGGAARLLADLGTNGELLLFARGRLYATATALGTAFEGGRFAYAADLLRAAAEAKREGVLEESGLLAEPYFTDGYRAKGNGCVLFEEDIRTLQLAKGAVRSGIELLLKKAGTAAKDVAAVFLAGGAGQYCREEDLLLTGLLPPAFAGKTVPVGNSCIGGLLAYMRAGRPKLSVQAETFNLAEEAGFEALYYTYMDFM